MALRHLLDGGASTALNLGTSRGHSVREVIAAVERVSNARLEVRERPRRDGDPPALVADARRARALLGWSPRHSTLDEMVGTAWRWLAREDDSLQQALPRRVNHEISPEVSP